MSDHDNIKKFLCCIRDRLNLALLVRTIQWAVLVTGAGLILAASSFILRGRGVPGWIYLLSVLLFIFGVAVIWMLKRFDIDRSGEFADNFFKLHDGVVSFSSFKKRGKKDGFYELQARQLENEITNVKSIKVIGLGISTRMFVIGGLLVSVAMLMGLVDDSHAYKQEILNKEQTLSKTLQVNEELEKELEEVIKELQDQQELDQEFKDQLKELKELLESLEVTEDQKKALGQYANIERKLYSMLNSTQQRKDELLLDRVGEKLKDIQQGRQLGSKLSQKDYKAAAQELGNFKLNPEQKDSQEAKKELAKLKSISQQMAAAASSSLGQDSQSQNGQQSKSGNKEQAKSGDPKNGNQQSPKEAEARQSLAKQMSDLNKAVENYQKNQSQSGCQSSNEGLENLSKSLSRLGSKRSMQEKMRSFSQKLGQCQSFMSDPKSQSMAAQNGAGTGGKEAGTGSDNSRTDRTTPDVDNGNIEKLEGLKSHGPSEVTIEEVSSGGGVSSQGSTKREVEYRKQAEAYIQRKDVPAEVKQGVKRYFENIHTD